MKKIFTLFAFVLLSANVFAQAPQKMSFQAVIRNISNDLVALTSIGMKISIVQGSDSGTVVYSETQSVITNNNGLATLEIGNGSVVEGTFVSIDWSQGPYFIKTETDPTGGTNYTITGTSQLMSVPYALFSANGVAGEKGEKGDQGIQGEIGAIGQPGIPGDQGIQGEPGIQGIQGEIGARGEPGIQGEIGPAGATGSVANVGAISVTSTANGASISEGVLSLAPADENNGGIVTTGNQTIAGAKTFSSDVTINGTSFGTNGQLGNIGIGIKAGFTNQGSNAVAIGNETGMDTQGSNAVAIGAYTASVTQGLNAVAVGNSVGYTNQGISAVAIGNETGHTNQGTTAVAIGSRTGYNAQGTDAVAIGNEAGTNTQGSNALAIGAYAASITQGSNAVAVGYSVAYTNQGPNALAIGYYAASTNQGSNAIAIGSETGYNAQGIYAVAVGASAGSTDQGPYAIAMGINSGNNTQGINAVAIGENAGYITQGSNAVAIGLKAGEDNQGSNAIAIGQFAGQNNQAPNSIILNASGNELSSGNSGFFVSPITSKNNSSNLLTYDTVTNEISYDSAKTFVINHPTKPDSYLVHACLEGPEAGVYYRGESQIKNNQSVTVKLPDYVSAFATNFSIQITPIYADDSDENIVYRTSRVKDNSFTVHGKNGSFYWSVYGQRSTIEVEPKKASAEVGGDGPYKYIKTKNK